MIERDKAAMARHRPRQAIVAQAHAAVSLSQRSARAFSVFPCRRIVTGVKPFVSRASEVLTQ